MPDPRITQILQKLGSDERLHEELLESVYEELKAMARRQMAQERRDHTLQATALVNEAYMRLVGDEPVPWENRAHFFAAAGESMRRILIDHARRKGRRKRGGDRRRMALDVLDLANEGNEEQVLALDEALTALEAEDPRSAMVVRLRFYAGLSVEHTARVLGVSERTIMREWRYARAELYRLLGEEEPDEGAAPDGA